MKKKYLIRISVVKICLIKENINFYLIIVKGVKIDFPWFFFPYGKFFGFSVDILLEMMYYSM